MLPCNIGNNLIKRQSEKYIIMGIIDLSLNLNKNIMFFAYSCAELSFYRGRLVHSVLLINASIMQIQTMIQIQTKNLAAHFKTRPRL